jgi:hypothetical protein
MGSFLDKWGGGGNDYHRPRLVQSMDQAFLSSS